MFQRLNTANEQIVEILLSKGQVYLQINCYLGNTSKTFRYLNVFNIVFQLLPALRFLRSITSEDSASPRKFLEAAINAGDSTLFYTGIFLLII